MKRITNISHECSGYSRISREGAGGVQGACVQDFVLMPLPHLEGTSPLATAAKHGRTNFSSTCI